MPKYMYVVCSAICIFLIKQAICKKYTYNYDPNVLKARKADHPIHRIFLSRWSPRELTGESVPDSLLNSLFESARWSPSSYNSQPWRFVYAKRDSTHWQQFVELLVPQNQAWAKNAGALVIVISSKTSLYNGKRTPALSHTFDTGAAWMAMALEGNARGFVVHPMGGLNYDKVYEYLGVTNATHKVEAMLAIGKQPAKSVRKMSEPVSQRNPIDKFVFDGVFVNNE